MAKLGMPTVVVKFIEAGIEAIQRSQRGIVALILEDTKTGDANQIIIAVQTGRIRWIPIIRKGCYINE